MPHSYSFYKDKRCNFADGSCPGAAANSEALGGTMPLPLARPAGGACAGQGAQGGRLARSLSPHKRTAARLPPPRPSRFTVFSAPNPGKRHTSQKCMQTRPIFCEFRPRKTNPSPPPLPASLRRRSGETDRACTLHWTRSRVWTPHACSHRPLIGARSLPRALSSRRRFHSRHWLPAPTTCPLWTW